MKFANANSFKSKMKDIAKKKGVPAQQVCKCQYKNVQF